MGEGLVGISTTLVKIFNPGCCIPFFLLSDWLTQCPLPIQKKDLASTSNGMNLLV